jgi:peptide/nickel transport system substrate-binding protein
MVNPGALTLLLLCLVLLAGCAESPRDNLRFGLTSMPVTLDPRHATDAASSRINRLLYQQLVDFDDQAMPTPSLASWTQVSPTHYRFQLDTSRALQRRHATRRRRCHRDL